MAADETLSLTLTAQDMTAGAFSSVQRSMGNVQQRAQVMSVSVIQHVRQMGMSFVNFGASLASGSIIGSIQAFAGIIIGTFRTMGMQIALATGGISALAGVIALLIIRAKNAKEETANLFKEAEDRSERIRKLELSMMTEGVNRAKARAKAERDTRLAEIDKMITEENAAQAKAKKQTDKDALDNTNKYLDLMKAANQKYTADLAEIDKTATDAHRKELEKRASDEKTFWGNFLSQVKTSSDAENAINDEKDKAFNDLIDKEVAEMEDKEKRNLALAKDIYDADRDNVKNQMALDTYKYNQRIKNSEKEVEAEEAYQEKLRTAVSLSFGLFAQMGAAAGSFFDLQERLSENAAQEFKNKSEEEKDLFKETQDSKHKVQQQLYSIMYEMAKREALRQYKISQGVSVTQAALSGILAAVENFEKGSKIGGWPVGLIFAGISTGITSAQIATIKATPPPSFQTAMTQTRIIPGPSTEEHLVTAHGGEKVGRRGEGMTLVVNGNVFNSEETLREIYDGLTQYKKRTGVSL